MARIDSTIQALEGLPRVLKEIDMLTMKGLDDIRGQSVTDTGKVIDLLLDIRSLITREVESQVTVVENLITTIELDQD